MRPFQGEVSERTSLDDTDVFHQSSTFSWAASRSKARKADRRQIIGFAQGLLALWALAVATPAFIISNAVSRQFSVDLSLVLQLAVLLYSSLRLAVVATGPTVRPMAALFWLFGYIALGVVPLAQMATGLSQPVVLNAAGNSLDIARVIVLIGFLAYDFGANLSKRRQPYSLRLDQFVIPMSRVSLLLPLAVAAAAVYAASLGVRTFFLSRQEVRENAQGANIASESGQTVSGILTSLGTVPILVALLCSLYIAKSRQASSTWIFVVLATALMANAVVNNPISNPRNWFLTVALSIVLLLSWPRRTWFMATIAAVAVGALILFPYTDYFRYTDNEQSVSRGDTPLETLSLKDYDQMVMIANGVSAVEVRGHSFGVQAAGAAAFWVPRDLWEDKPRDTGTEIAEFIQSNNLNLSSPLWIEAWYDWGLPGVAAVFLLFGAVAGRLDSAFSSRGQFELNLSGVPVVQILVPVLASYQFILLRGPLLQASGRAAVVLLLLIILSKRHSVARREGFN